MLTRLTRAAIAVPAAVALVTLAAPAAGAATPAQFDAPIFGTTATLAETKMPTLADIRCSDAKCTAGLINGAVGGDVAYSSQTVAKGGAFAESPGFIAKLNKYWSNITQADTENFSLMTINLAQFAPGTDMGAVVDANAKTIDATVSAPESVGAATVWSATSSRNDGNWTVEYVASGDTIARGTCVQYGTEKGSVTCNRANLRQRTLDTVNRAPATTLTEAKSIAGLLPQTPKGLDPQLLNIEPAQALLAETAPVPALLRALAARKNAVALQYGVLTEPNLLFTAQVGAVNSEAPARSWVRTICQSSTKTSATCALTKIRGIDGYVGTWNREDEPSQVSSVAMHVVGGKKIGYAMCRLVGVQDRGLTKSEQSACTHAITTFAKNLVK